MSSLRAKRGSPGARIRSHRWPRCARHDGITPRCARHGEGKNFRRCERSAAVQEPESAVIDGRAALAMTGLRRAALAMAREKNFRRCERSAAVQEPESAVMDGRAALAMTGLRRAALAMTGRVWS